MAENRPPTAPGLNTRTVAPTTRIYLVREWLPGIDAKGMPVARLYLCVGRPTRRPDGTFRLVGWPVEYDLPHPNAAASGFRVCGPRSVYSVPLRPRRGGRRPQVEPLPAHLAPPPELIRQGEVGR